MYRPVAINANFSWPYSVFTSRVCTMRTVAVFMTLICRAIRRALRLSPLKKAALAVAGVTAVVTPIMVGVYTPAVRAESPQLIAPSTGLGEAKFDVASIKPASSACEAGFCPPDGSSR